MEEDLKTKIMQINLSTMQIIKQTHEEKVAMYMKLPKEKIIEMLIASNEAIDRMRSYCVCESSSVYIINGEWVCSTCNKHLLQ